MPNEIEDTVELDLQRPELDEAGAPAQAAAETPAAAASSPATDVSKTAEPDTLSIVRDVVEKRGEGEAAASSANGEDEGDEPATGTTPKDGDDYSDVPFNKHPRFQEVLAKAKANETDAVRYRNVQAFLDKERLSGEDAANGLTLLAQARNSGLDGPEMADGLYKLALCKHDPVAGWNAIRPWVQQLLIAAGEVLPADLQQRVQAGDMSPDAAVEQSRLRAQVQTHQAQQTYAQQRAQADQQSSLRTSLMGAASEWEAERTKRDPNFASKLPAVEQEVRRLQSMGWVPTTPDAVKEQLRRAYAAVNGGIRTTPAPQVAPAAAQRRPLQPITGGQVAGNTAAAPSSTMDHVNAVLAKRRAG